MNITQWQKLFEAAKQEFGDIELGIVGTGLEQYLRDKIKEQGKLTNRCAWCDEPIETGKKYCAICSEMVWDLDK